jgi:hypothetical protein
MQARVRVLSVKPLARYSDVPEGRMRDLNGFTLAGTSFGVLDPESHPIRTTGLAPGVYVLNSPPQGGTYTNATATTHFLLLADTPLHHMSPLVHD